MLGNLPGAPMDAHNHHGSRNVLSVKAQECPVFSTTVACMDTHSLQFWTGKLGRALDRECRVVWEEDKGHHENSKASRLLHIKSNSPNPRHHESHHLYCFLSQCTRGHCPENLVFDALIGNNQILLTSGGRPTPPSGSLTPVLG